MGKILSSLAAGAALVLLGVAQLASAPVAVSVQTDEAVKSDRDAAPATTETHSGISVRSGRVRARGLTLASGDGGASRSPMARAFALPAERLPPELEALVTGLEQGLKNRIEQRLQRDVTTRELRTKAFFPPPTVQASRDKEENQK